MLDFYNKAKFVALAPLILTGCMSGPSPQASSNQVASRNAAQSTPSVSSQAGAAQAAQSPGSRQESAPQGAGSMKGMDHSSMSGMQGMNHSSMDNMKGMDHSSMKGMQGMDHSQHGSASGAGHGASAAGKPGNAAQAKRTVNVTALDTMRFDPQTLRVQAGETIRFVVTNKGKLPHEFVIGTPPEQKQHAEMMQKMPNMKHEEANAISLEPGETKTLTWQFAQNDAVEIACHVPGHYPAGMVSKVTVGSAR